MKVSVIGATGRVGKAAAFSLAEESVVSEVVLVSREKSLSQVQGEALDMNDAMAAKDIRVSITPTSNFEDISDSKIVVITSGVPRTSEMTRMDVAVPNAKIVAEYARLVAKHAPESIILVITNPVDIMTYVAYKASGFPRSRVIGLGNHLDSLRLKNLIAKHFNIHVSEIHTRIIGEHGDHMVLLLSSTSIGGILVKDFPQYQSFDVETIVDKVKNAGSYVINKKGATEYGPAFAISNTVKTIINDEKRILTLTTYLDGEIYGVGDVCLGVPVKLGINGVERIIGVKMNDKELEDFITAAKTVKKAKDEIMATLEGEINLSK
ncbi:malate dehydrogenase [anaerobic digester metagenome]|jgi:malate dehydrogenase|uniref:Malate dehydrogenase n=3 Tax=Methanobacterium subterraneum TaxID=59277 RepID=A0A2H4VQC5_9EURY|nr:malate dehydrogenase [Methanobacterium subterraneum]AUB55853.1 malate dehydrogenase [Methanobacterium subterraneum]AUB60281.1 malate dehydrogenase [Methanobacterium subterraneum]PKL71788.1 MAG: malate dehydrogenase [Methanobacteriales archaeon HGW-Methanobacteriales-2]